jgi:hypothetical protein
MIATELTLENLTLTIHQEIHGQAPLDVTFAALLEQLGPGMRYLTANRST